MIEVKFIVDYYDKETKQPYRKGRTGIFDSKKIERLIELGVIESPKKEKSKEEVQEKPWKVNYPKEIRKSKKNYDN